MDTLVSKLMKQLSEEERTHIPNIINNKASNNCQAIPRYFDSIKWVADDRADGQAVATAFAIPVMYPEEKGRTRW